MSFVDSAKRQAARFGREVAPDVLRKLLRLDRRRVAYSQLFFDANGKLSPNGQTVLADLRKAAGIDKGGIVISPVSRMTDPYATAYRAGQRDLYLRIVKYLGLDGAVIQENDDE